MKSSFFSEQGTKSLLVITALIFVAVTSLFLYIVFSADGWTFSAETMNFYGGLIGGIIGPLVSLASVVLFYVALREQRQDFRTNIEVLNLQKQELQLQREELESTRKVFEEQSTIMKFQQNESTFFKMLENHRNLVSSLGSGEKAGYPALDKLYSDLKRYIKAYKEALHSRIVSLRDMHNYHPQQLLKTERELYEQLSNDIIHIIKFINEKLNGEVFYHESLYHTLTNSEKYLFGLVSHLELIKQTSVLSAASFDYQELYKHSNEFYYTPEEGTLPELEITFDGGLYAEYSYSNPKKKKFPFLLLKFRDDLPIKVIKYSIEMKGKIEEFAVGKVFEKGMTYPINLYTFLDHHYQFENIIKDLEKNGKITCIERDVIDVEMSLVFIVEYNGVQFEYPKLINSDIKNFPGEHSFHQFRLP
jgi:hypothetical protein